MFRRNAGSGRKKLSRILMDMKIPRHKRRGLPVIALGNRIIGVYGLGADWDILGGEEKDNGPFLLVTMEDEAAGANGNRE